ncbi:MAG: nuclear transport factor 2 family protein [Gemmatimonadetes bacterium]|nr:nuclear transport factor 2 family protein [Gemmatimonadota bacterium]
MKRLGLTLATVLFAVAVPSATAAQEWSSEQREVWSFVERCTQAFADGDIEAGNACLHEDFSGFAPGDDHLRGKRYILAFNAVLADQTPEAFALRPLDIQVHGNFAFVHYLYTEAQRDEDGEVEMSTVAWTDLLIKDNGRWYWIGDHGHRVGGSDDDE